MGLGSGRLRRFGTAKTIAGPHGTARPPPCTKSRARHASQSRGPGAGDTLRSMSDSAGVHVPPPFLFLIAIVGGLLLHQRWPLPLPAWPGLDVLGAVLIASWLSLMVPAILRFWRAHTSILPFRPATALVQGGVYRFTRNPMYLGFALLTVACGLLFQSLWPMVLLPPVLYLVQRLVIAPEERYLRRRFGAEYEAYTQRVRRWI